MSLAYFDLASGASGDMLLAAIAHAGRRAGVRTEQAMQSAVTSLQLGCSVTFEQASRAGLACLLAKVRIPDGNLDVEGLRAAIGRADVADRARALASSALQTILRAEARVHGAEEGDVHLHEMGSADTAADLIGVAAGLDALGIVTVAAAPVPAPRGWMTIESGTLPLPAPATLEMLRGAAMYGVADEVELVTPTAAALLVASKTTFGPMPAMVLDHVGVGGGSRDLKRPNICRILVGTASSAPSGEPPSGETVPAGVRLERDVLLETNIDDQAPETLGPALDALLAAGAKDAWITPIVMKKSRPAFLVSVLVAPETEGAVLDALFRNTTTLGARRRDVTKWAMDREVLHVHVRGTNLRVKIGRLGAEVVTVSPEFDDCLAVAGRTGVPILEIYAEASEKARRAVMP